MYQTDWKDQGTRVILSILYETVSHIVFFVTFDFKNSSNLFCNFFKFFFKHVSFAAFLSSSGNYPSIYISKSLSIYSVTEEMDENGFSGPSSLGASPTPSEDGDADADVTIPPVKKRRNRSRSPQHKSSLKHRSSPPISGFLDMKIWKRYATLQP